MNSVLIEAADNLTMTSNTYGNYFVAYERLDESTNNLALTFCKIFVATDVARVCEVQAMQERA